VVGFGVLVKEFNWRVQEVYLAVLDQGQTENMCKLAMASVLEKRCSEVVQKSCNASRTDGSEGQRKVIPQP
jgi:hypothetical protein